MEFYLILSICILVPFGFAIWIDKERSKKKEKALIKARLKLYVN